MQPNRLLSLDFDVCGTWTTTCAPKNNVHVSYSATLVVLIVVLAFTGHELVLETSAVGPAGRSPFCDGLAVKITNIGHEMIQSQQMTFVNVTIHRHPVGYCVHTALGTLNPSLCYKQ